MASVVNGGASSPKNRESRAERGRRGPVLSAGLGSSAIVFELSDDSKPTLRELAFENVL